jgi:hypothetical protein
VNNVQHRASSGLFHPGAGTVNVYRTPSYSPKYVPGCIAPGDNGRTPVAVGAGLGVGGAVGLVVGAVVGAMVGAPVGEAPEHPAIATMSNELKMARRMFWTSLGSTKLTSSVVELFCPGRRAAVTPPSRDLLA